MPLSRLPHVALSRGYDGTLISGCWIFRDPYVWVRWTASGTVKAFKVEDFEPVRRGAGMKGLRA